MQFEQKNSDMYDPAIEKLIDAALVDGELTEKEKQVLYKKAESLGIDLDEFEMVLDARLYRRIQEKRQQVPPIPSGTSAPQSNKFGNIKKCPACGALVGAFKTVCPECDFEFRDVEANKSIIELTKKINLVREECEQKEKNGDYKNGKNDSELDVSERKEKDIAKKMNNVISNFQVPNSREDIIELLQFIQPKVQNRYSFDKNALAWRQKYIEIINRAKMSYANDDKMMSQIEILEKNSKPSGITKLYMFWNSLSDTAKIFIGMILLFVFLLILAGFCCLMEGYTKDSTQSIQSISEIFDF